jgi:uncharacterized iron-regulated membrane protein
MQPAVVLGLGGFLLVLIIAIGLLMFIVAGAAIWKMRKDEFWDEPMS